MRILILVLSFTDHPYNGFLQAQQETWDSVEVAGVNTMYYAGKVIGTKGYPWQYAFNANCSDEYFMMHWKFAECLRGINYSGYDLIFRTNSSSYVNKKRLLSFAETLPKERCYAGWGLDGKQAVSGAGIFLSPDMVDILRDEIPTGKQIEEDLLIGRILHVKHGIEIIDDRSRWDVWDPAEAPLDRYHYRFRTDNARLNDIRNIYQIHKRIKELGK